MVQILLIEENDVDKIVFESHLKKIDNLDYDLYWIRNGEEALKSIGERYYDIIFLDHNPDDATGFAVLEKVQKNRVLPIVFLSEVAERELHRKALALGASGYITKSEINAFLLERTIDYTLKLFRAKVEAEIANQTKGEFIDIVSHELRTPLTAIKAPLDYLLDEVKEASEREMVAIAKRNTDRLLFLVNDLLDFQEIESGVMKFSRKESNFAELIEQAVLENEGYASHKNVLFEFNCSIKDAVVSTDPVRMKQIMANLLSNAAKFSPAKGEVKISVDRVNDKVRVSVIDNGPGIPKDFYDKIFDKFTRVDPSDTREIGGTGLGLAISKNLVQQMDGEIGFDSELGVGTKFWVQFPEVLR